TGRVDADGLRFRLDVDEFEAVDRLQPPVLVDLEVISGQPFDRSAVRVRWIDVYADEPGAASERRLLLLRGCGKCTDRDGKACRHGAYGSTSHRTTRIPNSFRAAASPRVTFISTKIGRASCR